MADVDAFQMPATEIGRVLNPSGTGTCPWCFTGGPIVVGVHGVAWRCGHARSLPPLHSVHSTVELCPKCTPLAQLRAVA